MKRGFDMKHTVFITGGTKGIGKACTDSFLAKGFNVVATYRSDDDAADAMRISHSGESLEVIKCNAADFEQTKACWQLVTERFGGADIIINNAGISQQKMFCDISRTEWEEMLDVNIGSAFNTVKCAYDYLVSCKWGRIINVSSIWGITGASCEVHYSASKAALIGFTKALAKELGPSGITVNCVAPGVIDTAMNSHLSADDIAVLCEETPLCRTGSPAEVASLICYLASDDASFITGQVISPNGGIVI